MPLLLRLLLCLTLLANTVAGAWAAPGMATAAKAKAPVAAQACHDAAPAVAATNPDRDHAHIGMHDAGGHDGGCCAHAGCECLQHCGTSISLPVAMTLAPAAGREQPARAIPGHGLPQPYQPVRPPIA